MLQGKQVLYWYGTPFWAVLLLILIFLLFAFFSAYYAIYFDVSAGGGSVLMQYFLYALTAGFLLAVARPRNWQRWTYFMLTSDGVVVPDQCPATRNTQWLAIPWHRVNAITVEIPYRAGKSPCLWLNLEPEEVESHFSDVVITNQILGFEHGHDNLPVAFPNMFMDAEKAVSEMNEILQQHR